MLLHNRLGAHTRPIGGGGNLELTAGTGYANPHERDAVSAALDAYRSLKNKFQNIAKRVPPGIDLDEVRAGVLRGRSIEAVLADLSGRQKPAPAPPESPQPQPTPPAQADDRLVQLERQVRRLQVFVQELEERIAREGPR